MWTEPRFRRIKNPMQTYACMYHKTSKSHSNKHQWSEHFNNDTALIQNRWDNFINGDMKNSTMTGIPFNKLMEIHAANIHMMSSASELLVYPSCPTDVKKKVLKSYTNSRAGAK